MDGGPGWIEFSETGIRHSFEYADSESQVFKGCFRAYNSDKSTTNVKSTEEKISTPGWLNTLGNFEEYKPLSGKVFSDNGHILEGLFGISERLERPTQKEGVMWKLKEDGSYDKFKVEVEREEKEATEIIKRDTGEFEIRTFIRNEKID